MPKILGIVLNLPLNSFYRHLLCKQSFFLISGGKKRGGKADGPLGSLVDLCTLASNYLCLLYISRLTIILSLADG